MLNPISEEEIARALYEYDESKAMIPRNKTWDDLPYWTKLEYSTQGERFLLVLKSIVADRRKAKSDNSN